MFHNTRLFWNLYYVVTQTSWNCRILEYKHCHRASLVAQWLGVHLPMQGTQVQALVREDPTCCGATKPVHHNY